MTDPARRWQGSAATGGWLAMIGPRAWLLIDAEPSTAAMAACWELVCADADADALLSTIADHGLREVPSFVLFGMVAGRTQVVLRGAGRAELAGQWLDAGGAATWVSYPVDEPADDGVTLWGAEPQAGPLPVVVGMAWAGAIYLQPVTVEAAATPPAGQALDQPPDRSQLDQPQPGQPQPGQPQLVDAGIIQAAPWATAGHTGYGYESAGNAAAPIAPAPTAPEPTTPEPTTPEPTTPEPTTAAPPVYDPVAAPVDDELSGATLARADLGGTVIGPNVLAVLCPAGHLSPPHAATCRVCGATIPAQEPFNANRPLLGLLRLSTGDTVSLDRDVVMGRAPGEWTGEAAQRPHVVKLASPNSDISRNHLEVRLDGWHVLVTDLGSTNGTVATLPGAAPVRLHAGDPLSIPPGTVVTIADEISFRYDVMAG